MILLKYWWILYPVICVVQALDCKLSLEKTNPQYGKFKPKYVIWAFLLSLIPYASIFCYNQDFFNAFIVLTIINVVLICCGFMMIQLNVSHTLHHLQVWLLEAASLAITIALVINIHPGEPWLSILLGVDIFSIFFGSIASTCFCDFCRELFN